MNRHFRSRSWWLNLLVKATLLGLGLVQVVFAESLTIRLWPGQGLAPGSESWELPESIRELGDGQRLITNVRNPELSVYLPEPGLANGAAVVVLPGGAMRMLHIGDEIHDNIAWLNSKGVAVFVLKYRVLQQTQEAGRVFPGSPGGGRKNDAGKPPDGAPVSHPVIKEPKLDIQHANANPEPDNADLQRALELAIGDAQQALRLVRAHSREWHIDIGRVGMMGFSAGGGVALGAAVANVPGAMPDFIVSLFGPSLVDVVVPENAPPLFLATEADHGPVTEGMLALFKVWKQAGGSAELHVYQAARLRNALWRERFSTWMGELGFLNNEKAQSAPHKE